MPAADSDLAADIVVVGAGLSGICMAWHLAQRLPDQRVLILEARDRIGGTWDLFRYPGVRSDSDMATLGFGFRPWLGERAITDGADIRAYIEETADEAGLTARIRFGHRLLAANWDSAARCWQLEVGRATGATTRLNCRFLAMCSGYYRYDRGHVPDLPGSADFAGMVVHPQQWPAGLDVDGKRIAIVGSGATAVTLLPALTARGARVTMIQRTPSYIAQLPARDVWAQRFTRWFGVRRGYWLTRWKNILYTMAIFQLSRRWPGLIRRRLLDDVRREVGGAIDVERHFNPPYQPWDQRLCIAPDGDFFAALRSRRASVATGQIQGFDERAVVLEDGQRIDADIVVTATGLELVAAGGAEFRIDGDRVDITRCTTYKGAMLSGMPNLVLTMGYTNASWTLKCELIARWSTRLLRWMAAHDMQVVVPVYDGPAAARPLIDLDSGYIRRAADALPRQADRRPWTVNQNYFLDLAAFHWSKIDDDALHFSK